ncbi:MAG: 16S rRNA (cytosine(967)-C(5))-methyltransferase RsmB [Salinisphaera sp.]|nr:16S rRNA (cytosine(967)-C(5))-methyltransferase RsmB [Salinisphaera sp.]
MSKPADAGSRSRALAARAISAVIDEGRSLDAALATLPADLPAADRSLCRMLAYGTLRDHRRLDAMLAPRIQRPPQPLLKALLLVGLFQLEAMRVPPHAAVHATVGATVELKMGKARGMVNAILRAHQRSAPTLADDHPGLLHSYPDWLADAVQADWAEQGDGVLAAGNQRAPMHLRVNLRRTTRDAYLQTLLDADLRADPLALCVDGLTLAEPVSTEQLPGFANGLVSVQDGAAQLAADLMKLADGQRVLDACAAPGNKTAHLLERADIDLLALDIDESRLATHAATMKRLGLACHERIADAAQLDDWWDKQLFDRILLDAPCSGTGVIRRHPDIKWLRRASDIAQAATRQRALLESLWTTLAPGGRLVYATCSILRAEGSDVVAEFIAQTDDAREVVIAADWGAPEPVGRRIAPGEQGFDGFYYAVIKRAGG